MLQYVKATRKTMEKALDEVLAVYHARKAQDPTISYRDFHIATAIGTWGLVYDVVLLYETGNVRQKAQIKQEPRYIGMPLPSDEDM